MAWVAQAAAEEKEAKAPTKPAMLQPQNPCFPTLEISITAKHWGTSQEMEVTAQTAHQEAREGAALVVIATEFIATPQESRCIHRPQPRLASLDKAVWVALIRFLTSRLWENKANLGSPVILSAATNLCWHTQPSVQCKMAV